MTTALTNFREVGGAGLQPASARIVYRSNTERVDATAYPVHLDVVIDLRRDDEKAALPHPLALSTGYREVPLFDPAAGLESAPAAILLDSQYIDWLERHRATIADVFRTLARSEGRVLICCSAGKDRTGLASALLARLWGASLDRIGADYAATGPAMRARFAVELASSQDPDRTRIMHGCAPETMTTVIEHVERTSGSVRGYLRSIGLSDAEVDAL